MSLIRRTIKFIQLLRSPRWLLALRFGVAAGVEHIEALHSIGGCRTVIDIGGNRGQFALAARQLFPNARIVTFEPLTTPALRFRKVFAEDSLTSLHQVAIGPKRSRRPIHVSARDDSSSLLPIGGQQAEIFPGTAEVRTELVDMAPLDSLIDATTIEAPALLKVDVQGFELQTLLGCESLLRRFTYVYVECSFIELYIGQALAHEVVTWLEGHGFHLRDVYNMTYDDLGREIQADFLFAARSV